jgi:hypothetical protein
MKRSTPIKYTANTSRYNIRPISATFVRPGLNSGVLHSTCRWLQLPPIAFGKWIAKYDTALLNRRCDHCLRSPHWTHFISAHWGPHKTSTSPLLYRLTSTPCELPALQEFASSALVPNTVALPIPNAVHFDNKMQKYERIRKKNLHI